MTDVLHLFEVGVPLLALVSLIAVAWTRRVDGQVHRQVLLLASRLDRELTALLGKGQRIRLRIGLAVELYCGGKPAKALALAGECDELLAYVESLQAELRIQCSHVPGLQRRELRATHGRIVALANEARDLAKEFDLLDMFWTRQLNGMTSAKPTAARIAKFVKPVLP